MSDIDARLAQLRTRFRQRCRDDLAIMEADDRPAEELQRIAHRVAGMAGTLGMLELGKAAITLDQVMNAGLSYLDAKHAFVCALRDEVGG